MGYLLLLIFILVSFYSCATHTNIATYGGAVNSTAARRGELVVRYPRNWVQNQCGGLVSAELDTKSVFRT